MRHPMLAVYERYRDVIDRAASRYGVDPYLVAAVIYNESRGNPKAVSRAGARGLMQLMPDTARGLGVADPNRLYEPETNIMLGARYLSMMLRAFGGDLERALAAYNAGPNAVKRHRGVPPYRETKNYVRAVLNDYRQARPPPWGLMLADWLAPQPRSLEATTLPPLQPTLSDLPTPAPAPPEPALATVAAPALWLADWILPRAVPSFRGLMPHEVDPQSVPFGESSSSSSLRKASD